MNEELPAGAPPQLRLHIRIHTAVGVHDFQIDCPFIAFIKLVKGDGFLWLNNPTRAIPWQAITQFEEVAGGAAPPLAMWMPAGKPS